MLTKNKLNYLKQLQTKKGRFESGLFIAEGPKIAEELINSDIKVKEVFKIKSIDFNIPVSKNIEAVEITEEELKKISTLVTPNSVFVVAEIPRREPDNNELKNKLTIVLDDIQDPGNMGTIIRIADWFGIENIICSSDTVDCYNPKVVQATTGSIARVKIFYAGLGDVLNEMKEKDPGFRIYGCVTDGENIYSKKLSGIGCIIIGNESKGISNPIRSLLTDKISIPNYSHLKHSRGEAESLNAAVAAAVICAEFRRGE